MKYSLLGLLSKYSVKIPMIQRDYAQGRVDRKNVLDSILGDIKTSLDSGEPRTFDYVYGVIEATESNETTFYPLDGQQRLTTLWLVHWYVALKSGRLLDTNLGKFVYEIRESSTDFFEKLVKLDKNTIPNDKRIVDFIQDQTWFYKSWLQDPTISALLNAIDDIEVIFSKKSDEDFKAYWALLDSKDENKELISFELLELKSDSSTDKDKSLYITLSSADDLFVKMNARGRSLTGFENFKSDWDSNLNSNNKLTEYTTKIDSDWMDVFWSIAKNEPDEKVDIVTNAGVLFFQFINRFILNKIVVSLDSSKVNSKLLENVSVDSLMRSEIKKKFKDYSEGRLTGDEKSDFNTFKHVHAFKYIFEFTKDNDLEYKGSGKGLEEYPEYLTFLDYKDYFDLQTMDEINSILTLIKDEIDKNDYFLTEIDNIYRRLGVEKFSFLKPATTGEYTQEQRIFFYATCSFFIMCKDTGEFAFSTYRKWMQVIRNIIVNSDIRSEAATYNGLIQVKELADAVISSASENSNGLDINVALSSLTSDNSSLIKRILSEEITKAQAICNENTNKLEKLLRRAENCLFFNGVIEFLYKDENDNLNFDYEQIRKRFTNLKKLKLNKKEASPETIRLILKKYSGFEEIEDMFLIISKGFNQRRNELSFRDNILCGRLSRTEEERLGNDETEITKRHKQRRKIIEEILCSNDSDTSTNAISISNTSLYSKIIESEALARMAEESDGKYVYESYGCLHRFRKFKSGNQKNNGIYVDDSRIKKSQQLHQLVLNGLVKIDDTYPYIELGGAGIYWGIEISFIYNDKRFEWIVDYNESTGETKELIKYKPNKLPEQTKEWALNNDLESILQSF